MRHGFGLPDKLAGVRHWLVLLFARYTQIDIRSRVGVSQRQRQRGFCSVFRQIQIYAVDLIVPGSCHHCCRAQRGQARIARSFVEPPSTQKVCNLVRLLYRWLNE